MGRAYVCVFIYMVMLIFTCHLLRHLMLLMGSKLEEQILQAHWGSCLIMVIFLHHVFHSIISRHVYLYVINEDIFNCIAGCDALACAVCLF